MANEFRFDPEKHEYWLGSVRLPSVTQIINCVGFVSPYSKNAERALEGRYVHLACKLLAERVLDWKEVDPRILGWVQSYDRFLENMDWAVRASEVSLYDEKLLFAGTFDVDFASNILIDLKTGAPAKWHALQTAAYHHLYGRGRRGCLYLQADGSIAKLVEHRNIGDWPAFLTCLNFYKVRNQYGN